MAVFSGQNSERLGCATALEIFAAGRDRLRQAPFKIGERVLELHAPWNGSSVVTACEIVQGKLYPYWRVTRVVGNMEASESAERLISAPADWEEPPRAPLYPHKLAPEDFGNWGQIKLEDADYQAALANHHRAYAAWAEKHLPGVGHGAQAKLARELVNSLEHLSQAAE